MADQIVLIVPAVAVLIVVSVQDGFSCHFRYVLPVLPYAYIWISRVGTIVSGKRLFAHCGCIPSCALSAVV